MLTDIGQYDYILFSVNMQAGSGAKTMISYEKLWNLMKEKGITQYALIKNYRISPGQITRLKRNESVSTHTLEVFCKRVHCQLGDITEYIEDDAEQ